MKRLLLTPDDAPGNGPAEPSSTPAKPLGAPGPAQPPPAAEIVRQGQRTERELALERDKRNLETRVSELEDENRQLKTPAPAPAPKPKHWLEEL